MRFCIGASENFSCCWFHFQNVYLKHQQHNTRQTHKKGEFLHKINIHFVLMYFMLARFFTNFAFFFVFVALVPCNIITLSPKRRKMNYYLIYCNLFFFRSLLFFWYMLSVAILDRFSGWFIWLPNVLRNWLTFPSMLLHLNIKSQFQTLSSSILHRLLGF